MYKAKYLEPIQTNALSSKENGAFFSQNLLLFLQIFTIFHILFCLFLLSFSIFTHGFILSLLCIF